jgi:hypothetical protein
LHSTSITEMRLELCNKKGASKKYRIEYFDHPDQTPESGLTVSLFMPVQNR